MKESFILFLFRQGKPAEAIVLTVDFSQEENKWLAECLELGTATYADTLEDVGREISEAIELQLNECERLGFADKFLSEHGVRRIPIQPPKARKPKGPTWVAPSLAVG